MRGRSSVRPSLFGRTRLERRYRQGLWLVFFAGLSVRLAAAAGKTHQSWQGDPLYYHALANLIASGRGFIDPFAWAYHHQAVPTAFHPPLYSLVLALPSVVGFRSFGAHQITSCLVGAAMIPLVAALTRSFAGRTAAVAAAVVVAGSPNLWVIDGLLFSEGLAAVLVVACMICALRLHARPTLRRSCVFGVCAGLAALTRPETLLLLPLLGLPVILVHRRDLGAKGLAAVLAGMSLSCVMILMPWTVRNYETFRRPVLLSTNGEAVLGFANCRQTYYTSAVGFWSITCPVTQGKSVGGSASADESDVAARLGAEGLHFMADHQSRFVTAVVWARLGRTWGLFKPFETARLSEVQGRSSTTAIAGVWVFWALAVGAVVGCRALWLDRRRLVLWVLLTPCLVASVVSIVAYGEIRFRAVAEPSISILAVVGLRWVAQRLHKAREQHDGAGSSPFDPKASTS